MNKKSGLSSELRLTKFLAASLGLAITGVGVQSAQAQNWTAAIDQDYNTAGNWQGDVFPEGLNVVINEFSDGFFPILSADAAFTPVDIIVGNGGLEGRLDHRTGTLATGTGNWFLVGVGTGTGTYNLADTSSAGGGISGFAQGSGSLTVSDQVFVGGGDFNDDGVGVINMNTTGSLTTGGNLNLGGGWNGGVGDATFNFESGTISVGNELRVGRAGTGVWNQTGGTANSFNFFVIGREPTTAGQYTTGNGTVNLSGGTINAATGNGFTSVGSARGATGVLNVSGTGVFDTSAGGMIVAEGWTGTGAATGTVNVSGGGMVKAGTNVVTVALDADAVGTINLNGGTFEAGGVTGGAGTSTVNFNGGTLRAMQDNATFIQSLTAANVQAGGAVFDTNGFNATVAQALVDAGGNGGLIKLGAGTLTLTGMNTYMGDTSIYAGTLSINTTYLADGANVGIVSGGTFALDFVGTDTVNALIVDGTPQATGTWGALGSGADHESALFTGTGLLNVTSAVPEPGTLMLVLGGGASMLLLARRRNRRG